ncbi:MAG: hypothetical protein QNI96_09820 [Woeseiaceae bacterium]|nr:hypothetical protein [Woeseiaceae bacterium]
MDKLANRLRDDAERIDATISEQLDDRIRASLENVTPQQPRQPERKARPVTFWWASSLTGVAAAIAVIALVNLQSPGPGTPTTEPASPPLLLPTIEWQAETAVLVSPLEEEYENLQSDLEKAEQAVRQDIERLF